MKICKILLAAGLALTASHASQADVSAQAWLETYYLNPEPQALVSRVRDLSRSGYFEQPGHTAVAIGFLGTVFADNPARVDGWLADLRTLPMAHQRLVAAALWQSGHPRGGEQLRSLRADPAIRADVERLAGTPAQLIADTAVRSPSSMNLQWGAFLASGQERHITRIFDAIGLNEPGLTAAARTALAQNAAAHPRVMQICVAQLERQPSDVQSVLRAALQDAGTAARPPQS